MDSIILQDDRVYRTYDPEPTLRLNYLQRMAQNPYLDKSKNFRLVAHIDMNLVKTLADTGDKDAYAYFYHHDTKARDRMIDTHKELFKAV